MLLYILNLSLSLPVQASQQVHDVSISQEVRNKEEVINQIIKMNSSNIKKVADSIWGKNFKNIFNKTKENIKAYLQNHQNIAVEQQTCDELIQKKDWKDLRKKKDFHKVSCEYENSKKDLSIDDYRRKFVKEEMTQAVEKAMKLLKIEGTFKWDAIGKLGPQSDIDIAVTHTQPDGTFSKDKIFIEVLAKSLFDLLGVALNQKSTGDALDTECYIDLLTPLKSPEYKKILQDIEKKNQENLKIKEKTTRKKSQPDYQDLAFSFAQAQVALQLGHPVLINDVKIIDWQSYRNQFNAQNYQGILQDMYNFNQSTHPKNDSTENLGDYLPKILKMSESIGDAKDLEYFTKLLTINKYLPEGYFTLESLAYVCYSDALDGQLFKNLLKDALKNKGDEEASITSKEQKDIAEKNGLIQSSNRFINLVSAGENLGYFFHKLEGENSFSALVNSSKYLFRIVRALKDYWSTNEEIGDVNSSKKNTPQEIEYLKPLYDVSAHFEKLKRGKLPFASKQDYETIVMDAFKMYLGEKIDKTEVQAIAKILYEVSQKEVGTLGYKNNRINELNPKLVRFAIYWDGEKYAMDSDIQNQEKKDAANRLVHLINSSLELSSIEDYANNESSEIREIKKKYDLPIWSKKKDIISIKLISLMTLTPEETKEFVTGLVQFYVYTLKHYERVTGHIFQPINLN